MNRRVPLLLVLVGVTAGVPAAQAQLPPAVQRAAAGTVLIEARWEVRGRFQGRERKDYFDSNGSGFIIAPQGIIVTNNHVVDARFVEDQVKRQYGELARWVEFRVWRMSLAVRALSGTADQIQRPGSVLRYDRQNDLALLTVNFGREMTHLKLHAPVALPVGAPIVVCGFPANATISRLVSEKGHGQGGTEVSVSQGRITALRRGSDRTVRMLQLDAAVTGGNSGGPVLDRRGAVVGVLASTVGGSVNFAIAADTVAEFAEKYIPLADRPEDAGHGRAVRAHGQDAAAPARARWPEVVLHFKNGGAERGLLRQHTDEGIVLRLPGLGAITYHPAEIDHIEPVR